MRYQWDPARAAANLKKHGVSFADAVTVFEDQLALTREDIDSRDGPRFVTLGMDAVGRVLVVVYTYRDTGSIRVVSAWKADRSQRKQYEASSR